jgi:cullin 1
MVWILTDVSFQKTDSFQDEALLRYYAAEWDRYTTGANYINRLFTYLNRHWVKRERDEGRKGVYQVYTVSRVPVYVSGSRYSIAL